MEDMIQTEETRIPEEEILTQEQRIPELEIPDPEEIPMPEGPARPKRKKGFRLIYLCAAVALLVAVFFLTAKSRQYSGAVKLYEAGDYQAAAEQFAALEQYQDAPQQLQKSRYALAGEYLVQKEFAKALEIYESLGDYEYSPRKVIECSYSLGVEALEADLLDEAIAYFEKATDDYRDARSMRLKTIYRRGHELYMDSQYEQAQTYFDRLADYPAYNTPHFQTFDDAMVYIDSVAEQLPESITLVVKDMPGTYILQSEYLNIEIQQHMGYQFAEVDYDEDTGMLSVLPSYYPGQRLVQAWKSGDLSKLDEAELETYHKALDLVEQARAADPDPEAMELWLHDWICRNAVYDSPYMYVSPEEFIELRELTCVGVILDGVANCQGYTDAFYVLATMAGLDVCKMFGETEEGGHCWNAVRLDDWLYLVDVTFNDTVFEEPEYWSYIWYNNALDLNEYAVYGGTHLFYRVMSRRDLSKTYYTRTDSVYDDLGEAAFGLLRQYRYNGNGVYHAVVDSPNQTSDDFYKAVANNMSLAGVYSIQWYVNLYTYQDDTYIWVEWNPG